ncbi:MAG: 1-aminocyclopropane-1-carboxylate deaminase/D-cysteine desulfhydrase [Bacillota bacterium]
MYSIEKYNLLKRKIAQIKKAELGFLPTKLHKLERLSDRYDVNLYIKRDDLTGFSTFGGNKIRKLEFLFGEILNQKAKYVFTYGATQSNHAMQTAIACRKYGLNPILYLIDVVNEGMDDLKANMLLDKILGAEIRLIKMKEDEEEFAAMYRAQEESKQYAEEISEKDSDYYIIPPGGASPLGTLGFVNAYLEMKEQEFKQNLNIKHIFHPTGTGGTLAGLTAASVYLDDDIKVHGVNVSHKGESYLTEIAELASKALKLAGIDSVVCKSDVAVDNYYVGPGYEIPSPAANRAVKIFAESEGIFLDPVYTGKAAAGLIDYLEKGKIEKGSDILFWHTGGTNALFAEKKILGDLLD